jgi:hypothetical protein
MTKEREALKRLKQETVPATYNADAETFKDECLATLEAAIDKKEELESKLQRWYDLLSMDGINSKQKVKEEISNLLNILNNTSK